MRHLKTFESFKKNEIFSTIGSAIGKGVGHISNMIPKMGDSKGKDEDLGQEVLSHLEEMSRNYNRSGNYNPSTINKASNDWYYFIGRIFKSGKHKVDIMKHIDHNTKSDPEYTVIINKVNHGEDNGWSLRSNDGGRKDPNRYNQINTDTEKGQRLNISQSLAKKIFNLSVSIYTDVTKNVKDDARGK